LFFSSKTGLLTDSYYPKVLYFEEYNEAKYEYGEQISMGAICYLAECKESNIG
jgi:hypothetical protein